MGVCEGRWGCGEYISYIPCRARSGSGTKPRKKTADKLEKAICIAKTTKTLRRSTYSPGTPGGGDRLNNIKSPRKEPVARGWESSEERTMRRFFPSGGPDGSKYRTRTGVGLSRPGGA